MANRQWERRRVPPGALGTGWPPPAHCLAPIPRASLDEACLLQKWPPGLFQCLRHRAEHHQPVEAAGGSEQPSGPVSTAVTAAHPPPSAPELVCNVPPTTRSGPHLPHQFQHSLSHSILCTWLLTLKVSFDPERGPEAVPSPVEDTEAQRGEVTAPMRRQQGSGPPLGPRLHAAQPAAAGGVPRHVGRDGGPGRTQLVASGGEHGPKNLRPRLPTRGLEKLSDVLRVT